MSQTTLRVDPSCMDDFDPNSLLADEAIRRIQQQIQPTSGFEKVALRSALGRILYSDVLSKIEVPGHTNSAMDGYALRGDDLPSAGAFTLEVIGTAWAGTPYTGAVSAKQWRSHYDRRPIARRYGYSGHAGTC